ncbi:MAG: ABC transporter permease [Longimicrobiaceae bacterium]
MPALGPALRPNQWVSRPTYLSIAAAWAVLVVILWLVGPGFFPTPARVFSALGTLLSEGGLLGELLTSLTLFGEALLIAALLSMGLAYLSVVPALRPIIGALTRARFLSLVGLTFVFTMTFGGGHPLKLSLLVFGISAFLLTSMLDVVAAVPTERLDHARTLRMGDWRVVWEVVILGQMGLAFDALRQNAAIGWMMLTMVEGIARSEGGIGALLIDQNKHFHLAGIIAIQGVFLIAGFFQDTFLAWLKGVLVPFAALTTVRG